MTYFDKRHPLLIFIYFVIVIFVTMFTTHPILLLISFISSLAFTLSIIGFKNLLKSLLYSIPMLIMMAITNPLFVHKGETILFFMNDNPITLEAIIYGLTISVMIVSVFYWFKCFNEIMTTDKHIYLFGKVTPKLGLMISMVLSFVPKFVKQFKRIDEVQRGLGIYATDSYFDKIKCKLRVISILITWSLENSIDTSDSMRSRGYGLKQRTNYSNFKWRSDDTLFAIILLVLSIPTITLIIMGYSDFNYYPYFSKINIDLLSILLYIGLFSLMFTPTILEAKEAIKWHYLKSKI